MCRSSALRYVAKAARNHRRKLYIYKPRRTCTKVHRGAPSRVVENPKLSNRNIRRHIDVRPKPLLQYRQTKAIEGSKDQVLSKDRNAKTIRNCDKALSICTLR